MRVIQSYREHNVPAWIQECLRSVRGWAEANGYDYHCANDDEMLNVLPGWFKKKVGTRWPMLVDLGRLKLCRQALDEGCERVVWLDADVLVIDAERFQLPEVLPHGYAFGREVWVEEGGKVRRGVHNALCVFEKGNAFLDFYAHACERIIEEHEGEKLAPQLLGPKLLKALHAFMNVKLLDQVGMMSPWVGEDVLAGGGRRLECMRDEMSEWPAALNLCGSMLSEAEGDALVEKLQSGELNAFL